MKAIILAAGRGSRLRNVTAEPKCLLNIGGRTLLQRHLEALHRCGIHEVVLVVGYRAESLKRALRDMPVPTPVSVITNREYRHGSLRSLWAARVHIDGDLLLMDADVIYDPRLLQRLTQCTDDVALLIDDHHDRTGEEFIALLENDRIVRLGRALEPGPGQQSTEWVGFTLFRAPAAARLRDIVERLRREQGPMTSYEDAVSDFIEQAPLRPVKTGGLEWTEIDFAVDVERARALAAHIDEA